MDTYNYKEISQNLNCKDTAECGLFAGKAGKVILLYLLSKHDGENNFSELAQEVLNAISENIAEEQRLDFANGLAGIGWAVEWVAQNNFLEINTDEVLEDIDDILYKAVMYSSDKNVSLSQGTLGKLLFFLSRYTNKNPSTHRLKNIFHEECLVLLTDDLHEELCGEDGLLASEKLEIEDWINLGHIAYFMSDFLLTSINEPTVETLLYAVIQSIDSFLEKEISLSGISLSNDILLMFIVCCYYLAGNKHQHKYWQERAKAYFIIISNKSSIYNSGTSPFNYTVITLAKILFVDEFHINSPNILQNGSVPSLNTYNGKLLLYNLFLQNKFDQNLLIQLLMFFDRTSII